MATVTRLSTINTSIHPAITDPTGSRREWKWEGDVEADDCSYVGTVTITAPYTAGDITLDLTLECGDVVATNRYTISVT